MPSIETFTLRDVGPDGGLEQAEMVAGRIVDFIGKAEKSLVLALYDIRLPDPVGEIVKGWLRPNGLRVEKVRIPLGVIGIIYESRPNVTVDAAGLCLKSGNAVVRIALRSEMGGAPGDQDAAPTLKGGRLIGPLERILVFVLTLAGAYTLLAAVLAAKGIVRFPEISRDRDDGDRAEYFLIGSLVSWVTSLAAAFLVWWGVHAG